MRLPGRSSRFETGQLRNDVQEARLAMETRSRSNMLPLKQKLHKLGRGHWLNFLSQPADGQTMNARQQAAMAPFERGNCLAGILHVQCGILNYAPRPAAWPHDEARG